MEWTVRKTEQKKKIPVVRIGNFIIDILSLGSVDETNFYHLGQETLMFRIFYVIKFIPSFFIFIDL